MTVAQQSRREARVLPEPTRTTARILRSFHHDLSASPGAEIAEAPGLQSEVDEYLDDMLSAYGQVYQGLRSRDPAQTAYNRLARRLLDEALSSTGRIDRAVLAYAMPDDQTGHSVCASMVHSSPGLTTAFAVSDQGVTAPFTALRIAGATLRADSEERVLVLALDQAAIPWEPPPETPVPGRDLGVALLLGGAGGLLHWQATPVDAAGAARAVGEVLADVRSRSLGPCTLILGRQVPGPDAPGPDVTVRRAPSDLVCTSVWSEAHRAGTAPGGGTVAVVEYDPVLGYFCAVATGLEGR
ncbi:hypothetical protein [Nocardiopsis sp. CNT312]|uniref:hypothetical protein n=1 Tax=Nocardiopsis sp. CNT312 TaxID=1137268 RepID=UPI00048F2DBD|nr:hypothetical protein [Nocardiopsis sp. CNT312]